MEVAMPYCKSCGVQIDEGTQCASCASPKDATARVQSSSGQASCAAPVLARETSDKRAVETSQIVSGIWVTSAITWIIFSPEPVVWFLLLTPSLVGCIWSLSRNGGLTAWADSREDKLRARLARADAKGARSPGTFSGLSIAGACGSGEKQGPCKTPTFARQCALARSYTSSAPCS